MKHLTVAAMALAMLTTTTLLTAEETKSGLQSGDYVGAFYVTKLCGADEDGVKTGQNLCYRCKNGGRPQVMIFTRSSDEKVAKLLQELDKAIPKNSSKELRAFVNYLGENKASAKKEAEKLADSAKTENIPYVLPNEFANGPDNYGLNPKAEVTVIMAVGGQVKANYATTSADKLEVEKVVADLDKILK